MLWHKLFAWNDLDVTNLSFVLLPYYKIIDCHIWHQLGFLLCEHCVQCSGYITEQEVVDLYRREAGMVEAQARRAESRRGVPDRRRGVFEHSRHSVWLLWHLNSVVTLATSIHTKHGHMQMTKWPRRTTLFAKHHAWRKLLKYKLCRVVDSYRLEAWRAETRARRAKSRGGIPDHRTGVFEHSRHSVWLLWHSNSIWCSDSTQQWWIAAKKVLDLNCKVQDLLLEVVDLK